MENEGIARIAVISNIAQLLRGWSDIILAYWEGTLALEQMASRAKKFKKCVLKCVVVWIIEGCGNLLDADYTEPGIVVNFGGGPR